MYGTPVEATYVWVGLTVVGAAALGLATELPRAPPPDAATVAGTVDRVAASEFEATARQPLVAAEIRLGSHRIGLRTAGGATHASFAADGVVPVRDDGALADVLRGAPPSQRFDDPAAFEAALERARTRDPDWRPAPSELVVRRVTWGDASATLVGA